MTIAVDILTTLLPLFYGLVTANYVVYLVRKDPFAERTCTAFLVFTFTLHVVLLFLRYVMLGRAFVTSVADELTLVAGAVAGVYLYLERVQKTKATGAFIIGLATLLQIGASVLLPHATEARSPLLLTVPLLMPHIVTATLAYSAFAVGGVYGVMFVLLYRALKKQKFGPLFNSLPPLDVLASMGVGAAFLGWLLHALSIGVGTLMSAGRVPMFYADVKFVFSVLIWLIYGGAFAAYFWAGWRGRRIVFALFIAFILLVVSLIGQVAWLPTFHAFVA